jgi:hypothetical protein
MLFHEVCCLKMDVELEIMCTLRCMQDVHTQKSLGGQFKESR